MEIRKKEEKEPAICSDKMRKKKNKTIKSVEEGDYGHYGSRESIYIRTGGIWISKEIRDIMIREYVGGFNLLFRTRLHAIMKG